jgi:hypothetical protein
MSRSGCGEGDDCDNWARIKWRGQVASAIRGKRGQRFLRELRDALDAMPEKRLIAEELQVPAAPAFVPPEYADRGFPVWGTYGLEFVQGPGVCALGAVGQRLGVDVTTIDTEDHHRISLIFNIAEPLSREIMYMNDEGAGYYKESPESRWCRVRAWVSKQII